jgi:hypothetical protein
MDVYGHGKPTRFVNLDKSADRNRFPEKLPITESINRRTFEVPWFKHYRPEVIAEHANAYKKVIENHELLLADDPGGDEQIGGYTSFSSTQSNTASGTK